MPRFLSLLSFTDQGMRDVRQSTQRATDFRAAVETAGGSIIAQYWALGDVDGCVIFEAPNEETAAGLLLALGQTGNVRTRTIRVYDDKAFAQIVARI